MNFFEKEMRQMFDDNDIFQDAKFVGKTMLAKLDESFGCHQIQHCVGIVPQEVLDRYVH